MKASTWSSRTTMPNLKCFGGYLLMGWLILGCAQLPPPGTVGRMNASKPESALRQPIKAVVVTMFENGALRGDRPGELQLWAEASPRPQELPLPMLDYPLLLDERGVLVVCTGGGIANAGSAIMALGLDGRFDLSQAYWLIAGIAGGDPEDTSLGSAVWARHAVDGDLVYELDAREIPGDWPWGLIPLGAKAPAQTPADIKTGWTLDTVHFALNADLAAWAFNLTRHLPLADSPALAEFRAQYTAHPAARRNPQVQMGDTLASSTYWHGRRMNAWANDWVKLYAGHEAEFVTTNMEDTGTLTSLYRLAKQGLVDTDRIMVLRTVSNYSMPPEGRPAAWSVTAPYPDEGLPALINAHRLGEAVIEALIKRWPEHSNRVPGGREAGAGGPPPTIGVISSSRARSQSDAGVVSN